MKNYVKSGSLALIAMFFLFFISCDAVEDLVSDPFPKSFLGTWVDANENEVIVAAKSITFEGNKYTFPSVSGITINDEKVYAVNAEFDGNEQDFYVKAGANSNQLLISTFTATQEFVTYTKQ
jgi:hypothetical protein